MYVQYILGTRALNNYSGDCVFQGLLFFFTALALLVPADVHIWQKAPSVCSYFILIKHKHWSRTVMRLVTYCVFQQTCTDYDGSL